MGPTAVCSTLALCLSASGPPEGRRAFAAPLRQGTASTPPTLGDEEPALQLQWEALQAEERHARVWFWGWSGFYSAVIVGETAIAATTGNSGARTNAYVNIASSSVGLLAIVLRPPPAAFGLDAIRALPEATEEERRAKNRALRALFDRAVAEERFYRSPLNHVIGLTVNAGIAALLYFGYHLGTRALITLFGGSAVWEAQVLTYPAKARDAADGLRPQPALRAQWVFLGNGIAVSGSF
jgi:hypothetical protein